jgi:hypothetical protein
VLGVVAELERADGVLLNEDSYVIVADEVYMIGVGRIAVIVGRYAYQSRKSQISSLLHIVVRDHSLPRNGNSVKPRNGV